VFQNNLIEQQMEDALCLLSAVHPFLRFLHSQADAKNDITKPRSGLLAHPRITGTKTIIQLMNKSTESVF
jgi:hypothetical protein